MKGVFTTLLFLNRFLVLWNVCVALVRETDNRLIDNKIESSVIPTHHSTEIY